MKDIGKDKTHTWYSRISNHIDWKSVAPNSKLRQDLNKNDWTACFHMETNSTKNPVYLKRGRTFFAVVVLNHSSTRVKVYNCFWNNGFTGGEFTMPSLKVRSGLHYELSVYHVWTQKTFRELFSNDLHPNIHATIFKNRTCTIVGVFTLPF